MVLVQLAINGIAAGAIYALLAVGFAVIYNTTRAFHVAHGAVFTLAGYALYLCVKSLGLPYWLGVPLAIAAAAGLGVAIEVAIYRPIRGLGGGTNSILIASLGLVSFLHAVYALVFTTDPRSLRDGALETVAIGSLSVPILHIAIVIIALAAFVGLIVFLRLSLYGKAIRALADSAELAATQGIGINRTYTIVYALGSAFAGIAGVLVSLDLGVKPDMGYTVIFLAVVGVIIGGIGYLPGALLGGFLLGLVQQVAIWQIDSAWQMGVVFALLMVFLLFRPQGFFGSRLNVRKA